jgi:hypothetical protein
MLPRLVASVVNDRLPTNSCVDVSRSMRGAGAASSLAVAHVRQADQATGAAAERLAAATPHRRAGPAATDSGRAATRGSARRATERARRIIGAERALLTLFIDAARASFVTRPASVAEQKRAAKTRG